MGFQSDSEKTTARESAESETVDLNDYYFLRNAGDENFQPRAQQIWSEYLNNELRSRTPLIIMIGGSSAVGKSSLTIEMAKLFGIRAIVGTDMLRHTIATGCSDVPKTLSLFSHECWKAVSTQYSAKSLIEGFQKQCWDLFPAIRGACEHSVRHVQNTLIEGVHLIPELVQELGKVVPGHIVPIYIVSSTERLKSLLIPKRTRSTYMHRSASEYGERLGRLSALAEWWSQELQSRGVRFIENDEAPRQLLARAVSEVFTQLVEPKAG